MKRLSFALLFSLSLSLVRSVAAQPMMVDPSRMSGIPRPDPQVPAGTITVRLIRGELANRMVGIEVTLSDQEGHLQKQKTDENGRATFAGLSGGPFMAHAKGAESEELSSQPIELPQGQGVRVMLVFKAGALGSPDGVARPDKSVPPLTVIVKAVDGEGQPLAGLEAVLGHARAGENQVREIKAKTDAKGEARFDGLDAKPTSGYLPEVTKDGTRYAGKPFKLSENLGSSVVIEVRPVTKDLSALSLGEGSHFIAEVGDDALTIVEVWRLSNSGTTAVDPGPGGLHFPLPNKAVSTQVAPQGPTGFSATGHEAVWRGPIPPGDMQLQVMFALAYEGGTLEFRQKTPLAFAQVALVTDRIDGMSVDGDQLTAEDRELQGRRLVLVRGPGTSAGGEVRFSFHGLPHNAPTLRLLAVGMALGILLVLGVYASRGESARGKRIRLEASREQLIGDLAALSQKIELKDAKRQKKQDELTEKLTQLYRDLDEVQ